MAQYDKLINLGLLSQFLTKAKTIFAPKITDSGILKGDGAGNVSAATAGADYLAPNDLTPYRTAAAQDEIDAGLVSAAAAQSFSAAQQQQARENIGAVGEWTLMWENASQTSVFEAQTISLNLSGYTEIKMTIRASTSNAGEESFLYDIPHTGTQAFWLAAGKINSRVLVSVDASGVTFSGSRIYNTYGSYSIDNKIGVPIRIYAR